MMGEDKIFRLYYILSFLILSLSLTMESTGMNSEDWGHYSMVSSSIVGQRIGSYLVKGSEEKIEYKDV